MYLLEYRFCLSVIFLLDSGAAFDFISGMFDHYLILF